MKRSVILISVVAVFFAAQVFATAMSDIIPVLKVVKKEVNATLAEIDKDLTEAAKKLSGMDLKGDDARKILKNLCKFRPYVVDCSIIDTNGIKITVEPEQYRQLEGTDRSALPSVIALLKTGKPVMSDVYHSSEDVNAVSIGYPIFSDKGELLGAVRMLIRHEVFLKALVENRPCKIWVMQTNGLIVYDEHPDEIGKNIFSDSMFAPFQDLISFAGTVALSASGAGSYSFYTAAPKDMTVVQKVAAWDSVGLYGTEWRIVVMEVEGEPAKPAAK
jgi:hypothetical protein